jgi:hypothetical protein
VFTDYLVAINFAPEGADAKNTLRWRLSDDGSQPIYLNFNNLEEKADIYEHSEQARAPHTNGPRDVPRCGALSSSSKDAAVLQGGMVVVLRPLFAAALVVCRRYFIVAPSPFPAAQLVVHRR